MILKKVTDSSSISFLQINNSFALTSSPFNNTDHTAMGVGFWIIRKFTRGKSEETVKIRDDPIQIANNKSRIIDTDQLRFYTSKLSSSYRIRIRGFVIWGLRRIILSPSTCLFFKKGISLFVLSLWQIIESHLHHRIF